MKEAVEVTLESIYDRLQRSKAFAAEHVKGNLPADQLGMRGMYARFGDSRVARSEVLATPADLMRIEIKTEEMRNGIFKVGYPFNQDPLYREWLSQDLMTREQALRLFFVKEQSIIIKAELDAEDNRLGARLAMTLRQRDRLVDFGVDFINQYWLNIEFGEPADEDYAEYYALEALPDMGMWDYEIISHFMNVGRGIINERS